MSRLQYLPFDKLKPNDFLPLLNQQKVRVHLMEHTLFDAVSVKEWINAKIEMDAVQGCRVRAIQHDQRLVGWCGIQYEEGKYEIAIVLDESAWGLGKTVFTDIMAWAKELGLHTVYIHLLHTRPEYKFLSKIATRVFHSQIHGSQFTSYELAVQ